MKNKQISSVKDWSQKERPRERLMRLGPAVLSDAELLAILLRSGTSKTHVMTLSQNLLGAAGGLRGVLQSSASFLRSQHGLGEAKVTMLLSLGEILKRYLRESIIGQSYVSEPQAVLDFLSCEMRDKRIECFKVLLLDNANRILTEKTLFEGTVNQTVVYAREIIKYALDHFAAALILVHNHPSGKTQPSQDDRALTQKLSQLCRDMSLKVLDHLIIGDNQYYSFKENGLL